MKVEIKQTQLEYDGFVKVEKAIVRFERFNGGMSAETTRHRYFRGDAVAVLIYDPATSRVVLQRQFRYTAHTRTSEGWLTECVAGMMEENETPLEVAKREVFEETGLRLKQAELVAHYFIGPGGCSDQVYLYLGQVEDVTQALGVHGLIEEGEEVLASWVPLTEALRLVDEGKIQDAKTLLGLALLDRRLRSTSTAVRRSKGEM
ncbi:MAG: NUDIX domain-containing protein [Acidobacteria bacterium]|nr:NUDIX domain-containing protein [Acidobacteriota bacterium]